MIELLNLISLRVTLSGEISVSDRRQIEEKTQKLQFLLEYFYNCFKKMPEC